MIDTTPTAPVLEPEAPTPDPELTAQPEAPAAPTEQETLQMLTALQHEVQTLNQVVSKYQQQLGNVTFQKILLETKLEQLLQAQGTGGTGNAT